MIRRYFPDCAITTDLICGFPTESQESFDKTLQFIQEVGFAQTHVFGYSPRGGTVAAKYGRIEQSVIKDRVNRALEIADAMRQSYVKSFVGKTLQVLIEDTERGYMCGYSKQYIKCYVAQAEAGELYDVVVEKAEDGIAYCRIINMDKTV